MGIQGGLPSMGVSTEMASPTGRDWVARRWGLGWWPCYAEA